MALQILNAPDRPDTDEILAQMRNAIAEKIPGADIEVQSDSPGHFVIRVVSDAFADKGRVQQQQLVYGAITHLMSGPNAPVHAVDRLSCELP